MGDFLHACIGEGTKYDVYSAHADRTHQRLHSPPASMTILDSEGYMTSRERGKPCDDPTRNNLRAILSTVMGESESDVPPIAESSQLSVLSDSGNNQGGTRTDGVESSPTAYLDMRIESLCEQLSQREAECHELRELDAQARRQIARLKRDHACEFRVLQKAARNQDSKSKYTELSSRLSKLVLERDSLVSERAQLVSENTLMKQGLNAVVSDRNRIATDFNRLTKLGNVSPSRTTAVSHQVLVFSSRRPLAQLGLEIGVTVVYPGPTMSEAGIHVETLLCPSPKLLEEGNPDTINESPVN